MAIAILHAARFILDGRYRAIFDAVLVGVSDSLVRPSFYPEREKHALKLFDVSIFVFGFFFCCGLVMSFWARSCVRFGFFCFRFKMI